MGNQPRYEQSDEQRYEKCTDCDSEKKEGQTFEVRSENSLKQDRR